MGAATFSNHTYNYTTKVILNYSHNQFTTQGTLKLGCHDNKALLVLYVTSKSECSCFSRRGGSVAELYNLRDYFLHELWKVKCSRKNWKKNTLTSKSPGPWIVKLYATKSALKQLGMHSEFSSIEIFGMLYTATRPRTYTPRRFPLHSFWKDVSRYKSSYFYSESAIANLFSF